MYNQVKKIVILVLVVGVFATASHSEEIILRTIMPSNVSADEYSDGGELGEGNRTLGNTDRFSLGFITDNTNRLNITGTGRIGIGITNPRTTLQVLNGTLAFLDRGGYIMTGDRATENIAIDNIGIMARNNDASSRLYLQRFGGETFINGPLTVSAAAGFSDNVGIGATPESRLHVSGNATTTLVKIENRRTNNTGFSALGFYEGTDNTAEGIISFQNETNRFVVNTNAVGGVLDMSVRGTGIRIRDNGNIGIAMDPTGINRLQVSGTAFKTAGGTLWAVPSDRRIKKDIQDIDNALDTILKLRPVKFKYTKTYRKEHPSIENRYYYNFIAQEYQEVFPKSVQGSGKYLKDGSEILQLDAHNAQIFAIKAIQELKKENDELRTMITNQQKADSLQQKEISTLKKQVEKLLKDKR
jgi:hypothetical protein